MNVRDLVFEACTNAVDNGYLKEMLVDPVHEATIDMLYCAPDLETEDYDVVRQHILEWRNNYHATH